MSKQLRLTTEQYRAMTNKADPEKKGKFGNVKQKMDGHDFDSTKELNRYIELKQMQESGAIKGLKVHPSFPLEVNGYEICIYEADFEYMEMGGSAYRTVVEDCKGVRTPVYILKKRLMMALKGIEIRET